MNVIQNRERPRPGADSGEAGPVAGKARVARPGRTGGHAGVSRLPGDASFRTTRAPTSKGVSRRNVLKLMGASAALAGLTACTKLPDGKNRSLRAAAAGGFRSRQTLFYATAMPLAGYATGLLVESHMGRPTKVEGNPSHPASLGAANVFAQASVLSLYDPDRAQVVIYTRPHWGLEHVPHLDGPDAAPSSSTLKGAGLRILTGIGDLALAGGSNPIGARSVPAGEVASI